MPDFKSPGLNRGARRKAVLLSLDRKLLKNDGIFLQRRAVVSLFCIGLSFTEKKEKLHAENLQIFGVKFSVVLKDGDPAKNYLSIRQKKDVGPDGTTENFQKKCGGNQPFSFI